MFNSFLLDMLLTYLGNGTHQTKTGYKFKVTDRNNWFDWYNAFFIRIEYTFEATAHGVNVAAETQSAPINDLFSLWSFASESRLLSNKLRLSMNLKFPS